MKTVPLLMIAAAAIGLGGYFLSKRLDHNERATILSGVRAIAVDCGLDPARIRLLPRDRSHGPEIGITGFYLNPKTNQKDMKVACFEDAMAGRGFTFRDQMWRTNFVRVPEIP